MKRCLPRVSLAIVLSVGSAARGETLCVAYPVLACPSAEDRAAVAWLERAPRFSVRIVPAKALWDRLPGSDLLWIHIADEASWQEWQQHLAAPESWTSFYATGGRMLLTGYAALLPFAVGLESRQPEVRLEPIEDDQTFDQKGLQSFRGHPAFHGLFGGTYLWDGDRDHTLAKIGYFGADVPAGGEVVATEKAFVRLYSDRKLMVEYRARGRILTVGGFVAFGKPNHRGANLERFLSNCLRYLAGELEDEPRTYWAKQVSRPVRIGMAAGKPPQIDRRVAGRWGRPTTELRITRRNPDNQFFDLAGRRTLVMGKENAGLDEVWVHPFRLLRDYRAAVLTPDGELRWLDELPLTVEIRPESLTRHYRTPFGPLTEIVLAPLEEPGCLVRYQAEFSQALGLLIKFRSDLRWMWPYDADAAGDLLYGWDQGLRALHVRNGEGDYHTIAGATARPRHTLSGAFADIHWQRGELAGTPSERNQICHAALYDLGGAASSELHFVIAGTSEGRAKALAAFRRLIEHPEAEYARVVGHYRQLLASMVTIDSPDPEFNTLWKWALVGVDRFFARTPRLGAALLAGFATTARGWDGGQQISGRPGYAWYFGRDGAWAALAVDAYGDCDLVRAQLEFFARFQDFSGAIFHELSTSGIVHYDSADATPLFVVLAADYLRASGDLGFLREIWPALRKAMDFLYFTDTDGDGLIENTDVGHGWVEGGSLFGAHTTFYLAGIWAQALADAAYLAAELGHRELAGEYRRDADAVRAGLDTAFWNQATGFYDYGKMADGRNNPEKTILPAVPMLFGLLDRHKATPVLEEYARNTFSTDWGVRILGSDSPRFNPEGYHYGSVWPLYTGWTALAEFRYGRANQGFTHLVNNLTIKNHWAAGFVEEVMHGTEYRPSGVCPHQCWSETNVLLPGIAGMIGWRPDAPARAAELAPQFPLHWNRVTVRNLRVGDSRIELGMTRGRGETRYRLALRSGPGATIRLTLPTVAGMLVTEVLLDGHRQARDHRCVTIGLAGESELLVRHTGGVGMVPVVPRPRPGEGSQGYRIIAARLDGRRFAVELEGKSGTTGDFAVNVFDQELRAATGAELRGCDDHGIVRLKVPFRPGDTEYSRQTVILELR